MHPLDQLARELDEILASPAPAPARRPIRVPSIAATVPAPAWNVSARRVGGIWFLRLGVLQFSFCRTRKPVRR